MHYVSAPALLSRLIYDSLDNIKVSACRETMRKLYKFLLATTITPVLLTSCAPTQVVSEWICLPEGRFSNIQYDPTLVAKNIPAVDESSRYSGEVGDTVIRRSLFANFAGGIISSSQSTGVPYPKELAFYGGHETADVKALLSTEDLETLKVERGCRSFSVIGSGKALPQRQSLKAKFDAASRWGAAIEENEARGNSILLGFNASADAYLAKDYGEAKLWMFSKKPQLRLRDNANPSRRYRAEGVWDYDDPSATDLVVIAVEKKSQDGKWALSSRSLMAPSKPISVDTSGLTVSIPWPDSSEFFDQRLIYNGISGETIKFLYREFTDDLNRSSFEQEVVYDLKLGEVIGFKGARFVIHSATNTGVDYSILKPFNEDSVYRKALSQP